MKRYSIIEIVISVVAMITAIMTLVAGLAWNGSLVHDIFKWITPFMLIAVAVINIRQAKKQRKA